ncbi:MAG TPA: hypothetical protein VFG10_00320 [Saprospiraceae bacterium]|nr:hypothetical protein [Saprospiraceae bacterium]
MKNILLLTTLLVIAISGLKAQIALPEGMRYQAIARDNDGNIRSKESLTVKAELVVLDTEDEVVYAEIQNTTSGEFGLLNITIGEGKSIIGSFSKIPWSKQLWVRISIKNADNDDYQLVTTSKLYSVPYAFYAASAGSLTDSETDDSGNGSNDRGLGGDLDQTAIFWALDGNTNAHKYKGGGPPVLGTTDRKDLVFITKNIPRMIIDKDGNINFLTSIDLDGDLNVDGNTTLNGSLDVTNMSPTHLSGTLTVDKATTLNSSLTVANMSPTQLTGLLNVEKTLEVKGATTLGHTLDVTNMSPTHLTGTLVVDRPTTLNSSLTVTNLAPTSLTGLLDVDKTLNVDGASTLNSSLDVTGMSPTHLSGTLTVDKATTLNSSLTVTNISPTNLTGLLDVDKTLNVDGATTLNSSLDVTGVNPTHLSGTLAVDKATTLKDAVTVTNSAPTHLTGLLDVDKTMNIDGASTLNGTLDVTGMNATHLTGTLTVDKATIIKEALTVMNMSLTHLTGDLDVDGAFGAQGSINLDGPLTVGGMNPSKLTGTLEVGKLATLKAGLIVRGDGTLGPNGDHVAFFDNTEGGSSDGVAIRINNANTNAQNNFVTFYKGDNSIAGRIEGYTLNDIGSPPVPTSDEIWTAVCIAIADYNPITIFWTQFANQFNLVGTIWNGATIPAFSIPDFPGLTLPNFPGLTLPNFPGLDLPNFPGLDIPDLPSLTLPGIPALSIEGIEIFPGLSFPTIPGLTIPNIPSFDIPNIPSFDIPDIPAFDIPDIPAFAIPDVPEINLSDDLFHWPTIPTFSDILVDEGVCPDAGLFDVPNGYVYRLIEWGVANDMQNMISFSPIDLAAKVLTWGVTKVVKSGGVTYGSKGADYAEYLPKLHTTEQFMSGEIVGVHGGRISKVTTGADQILAISTEPLVLGNQPDEADKNNFAKVGFLGQVPVFVQGPVELGDYIIPSGKNDGIGKVIKPGELHADILPEIFGKAWSASPLETTVVINVSIGLRPTEIAEVLKQREESLKSLQQQINDQNVIHNELKADVNLLKTYLDLGVNPSAKRTN